LITFPTFLPTVKIIFLKNQKISGDDLGCWKWFNGVLKEANVELTEANKEGIENVIHKYIGEQSTYGRCSNDWKIAHKQVNESPQMRQELIEKLKPLASK
jgi:hypothetical protein